MIRKLLPFVPIVAFAATLALMQWIAGMPVTRLWLHSILVAAAVMVLVRFLPWDRWLFRVRIGSVFYQASLFVLFVRHFALIFAVEARRALIAQRMASPSRYGAGWYGSLTHAVAAFFGRALLRTERFYASLVARGIGG